MDNRQTNLLFDPRTGRVAIPKPVPKNCSGKNNSFDRPLSHSKDSTGSYQAADQQIRSGRLNMHLKFILDYVRSHPGQTSMEIARELNISRYDALRRLPNLADRKLIKRGAVRLCSICGVRCLTWWSCDE